MLGRRRRRFAILAQHQGPRANASCSHCRIKKTPIGAKLTLPGKG